jgi:hypothetical protein
MLRWIRVRIPSLRSTDPGRAALTRRDREVETEGFRIVREFVAQFAPGNTDPHWAVPWEVWIVRREEEDESELHVMIDYLLNDPEGALIGQQLQWLCNHPPARRMLEQRLQEAVSQPYVTDGRNCGIF